MARILVVDDAEQNLLLYQLYLKSEEFEVRTAGSGREALEMVADGDFDLVLLDVVMPEMDGIEVCRRLKATPRTASIPVIFFTGRMRDDADKQIAYEVGAVDYLTKPVEKQELIARIQVMLRFRQERANLERHNAELASTVRKSTSLISAVTRQLADYGSLLDATGEDREGVVLVDRQGLVLGLNPAAGDLLPGLSVGARIGSDTDASDTDASDTDASDIDGGDTDGSLGLLHAVLTDAGTTGGSPSEIRLDDGVILRVAVEPLEGSGNTVLRLRDATSETRIRQRIKDRTPADLASMTREIVAHGRGSYKISKFVGQSPTLRELTEDVDKLRQSRCTALIVGESGSGKEIVASALHFDGPYGSRPFIPIHCGAISPELIESELFGYEKGAFTGATTRKDGLFAACDGGTIFLDEIAETSLDLQVKLLRVLQQGEVRPVGATRPRHVDVRIIAATNKDLEQIVRARRFREDLFYRLDVVTLHLPPLRSHKDDIPLLVEHFLARFNRKYGRREPVADVTRGAMRVLREYDWPGNVRELENVIDRAFALGVGSVLTVEDLPRRIVKPQRPANDARYSQTVLREAAAPIDESTIDGPDFDKQAYERQAMVEMLRRCADNKVEAAQRLGMSRSTFYRKLKNYAIREDEYLVDPNRF